MKKRSKQNIPSDQNKTFSTKVVKTATKYTTNIQLELNKTIVKTSILFFYFNYV